MKFALVTGPNHFDLVEFYSLGYHLLLAPELLTDSKYLGYYLNKRRQGHFLIVDNGAAELGESLNFNDVLKVAEKVGADEIALPDVLEDSEATLSASIKHYHKVPRQHRMFIPQGRSVLEWFACLHDAMAKFDFATIGIPKLMEMYPGGRAGIIDSIVESGAQNRYNIHLLGCYKAPLKEVQSAYKAGKGFVRGIDTAAPLAYAHQGQSMKYEKHLSYIWNVKVAASGVATTNVADMLKACGGL